MLLPVLLFEFVLLFFELLFEFVLLFFELLFEFELLFLELLLEVEELFDFLLLLAPQAVADTASAPTIARTNPFFKNLIFFLSVVVMFSVLSFFD